MFYSITPCRYLKNNINRSWLSVFMIGWKKKVNMIQIPIIQYRYYILFVLIKKIINVYKKIIYWNSLRYSYTYRKKTLLKIISNTKSRNLYLVLQKFKSLSVFKFVLSTEKMMIKVTVWTVLTTFQILMILNIFGFFSDYIEKYRKYLMFICLKY